MLRLVARDRLPFVGREAELAALGEAWRRARDGEQRVVLVGGDPAIGKSRLVARFAMRVHGEGATVLHGHCPDDAGAPYQPFAEALREHAAALPAGAARAWPPAAADLGCVVPSLAAELGEPPPRAEDPGAARFRLFEAFSTLLEHLAAGGGAVLILEDLHDADPSTVELFEHVARGRPRAPLLVIGTYRRAELALHERLARTVDDLRRDGLLERVLVRGLPEEAVAELAGPDVAVEAIPALHRRTDGNPFYVGELVQYLGPGFDAAAVDEAAVSRGIRTLLSRRLAKLEPQTRIALPGAAVLGRSFEASLVAAISGQDETLVAAGLDEAVRHRLITADGPGRFAFNHDLIREVLVAELTPMRRSVLHRHALEVLERRDWPPVALARHALRAGEGEPAVTRAADAAAFLVEQLAYEAGAELYEAALAALGPWSPARHADLLLALGDARARAGDAAAARRAFADAYQTAEQLDDAERRAEAALGFAGSRGSRFGQADEEEIALLEAALGGLGDGSPGALRARLVARLAEARYGHGTEPDELSAEALRLAEEADEPRALAAAASARAWALWVPGRAVERLEVAQQLEEVGRRCGVAERVGEGLTWAIGARLELGDFAGLDADVERYIRRENWAADPEHDHSLGVFRAMPATVAARFDEAERLAVEAAQASAGRQRRDVVQFLGLQLLAVRAEQDRLHQIRSGVKGFLEAYPESAGWGAVLALCDVRSGRIGDAHRVLRAIHAIPRDGVWLGSMAVAAQAVAESGDKAVAPPFLEALEPYAGTWASFAWAATWGPVALWLAELGMLVGRTAEAAAWLDSIDAGVAPGWALRVRYARARLGAEPDRVELGAVEREAKALGMRALAGRAAGARAATPA